MKAAAKDKKPKGKKKDNVVKLKTPGIGHNSNGQVVPGLQKLVAEILASSARQKSESKLQRDLRNRAKSEFGILSNVLAEEIKKQKMDKDVRVQYEAGQEDVKKMLGYQASLDFAGAHPTKASVSQQPSETELAAQSPERDYTVDDEEEAAASHYEDEDSEDGHRPSVIEREG